MGLIPSLKTKYEQPVRSSLALFIWLYIDQKSSTVWKGLTTFRQSSQARSLLLSKYQNFQAICNWCLGSSVTEDSSSVLVAVLLLPAVWSPPSASLSGFGDFPEPALMSNDSMGLVTAAAESSEDCGGVGAEGKGVSIIG